MNIHQDSFLILGKGMTYQSCKEFFDNESVTYQVLETREILEIKDRRLILENNIINLNNIDHIIISPGISKKNSIVKKLIMLNCSITTDIEILQTITKLNYICIEIFT